MEHLSIPILNGELPRVEGKAGSQAASCPRTSVANGSIDFAAR